MTTSTTSSTAAVGSLRAVGLRTCARVEPVGIDDPAPEFAWHPASDLRDAVQTAWAVQVAADGDFAGHMVWDSGRTASGQPFGVRYDGQPLVTGRRYGWRVRLWDGADAVGEWSEPAYFETGVLEADAGWWRARWISGPPPASADDAAVLYLRGEVELSAAVVRGRAYASALGWYRLFVNGRDLTGPALVPRFTPFDEVVEYQVHDVTDVFRPGVNIVGMAVGDGRFRGRLGFLDSRAVYGGRLAGLVQIELDLADGSTVRFTTDASWLAGPGRITASDPKHGERADLRILDDDWLSATPAPPRLRPAQVLPPHPRRLIAEEVERVGEVDRLPAARVWRAPSGRQLVDFGQNAAGVVRIRLTGPAGTRVRLTHSELLTPDGELDTAYIQISKQMSKRKPGYQRDEVILDGGETWYQPWFTIHGFRYLEVDGLTGDLAPGDVEAVVLSSRLDAAGSFACSDDRLNRLFHNVVWSTRSNFTDTPTDCPTRERSGWTGDIQVFAPSATGIVDAQAFLRRYLRNLAIEQFPDGRVPSVIPSEASSQTGARQTGIEARIRRLFHALGAGATGWGDAAVRLPWTLYRYYGDRDVLERQYAGMRAWVDNRARAAHDRSGLQRRFSKRRIGYLERYILDSGFHYGEWLRPGDKLQTAIVDGSLRSAVVATAYLTDSARILAETAAVLGRRTDADRYNTLARSVRRAWQAAFVREDGRIGTDRQDDYVRALAFDLLEPDQRPGAAARLVDLIHQADDHLGTGFLSTPMLLPVLVDSGHAGTAFRLLMQTTPPSWLHQVERGATTTWETWHGYNEQGRGDGSHNHYAFGAVAAFLREYILGITPAEPGYRRIRIAPHLGGGLSHAHGHVETPYGTVTSHWHLDTTTAQLTVDVPAGTTADIHLPDATTHTAGSGPHTYTWPHRGPHQPGGPSRADGLTRPTTP